MAGYGWGARHPVKDWLFAESHRFGFFQAVRLLEMLQPEAVPLAEGADASREAVRFRSSPSLGFPAGEVQDLTNPFDPVMTVNFMGLSGALSPLPLPYTERLLRRLQAGDPAMRDFLDIFNHRFVSMVYRVRRKHRVGLESGPPHRHGFAWYLQALMGLGPDALKDRLKVPDRALLRYTGLLAREPRSTSILCTMLSDYFAAPVKDRQLVGGYRHFDEEQWTALGETGRNQRLGEDAVLGTRLWDQQAGIGLDVGPLGWDRYRDFLPGRPGFLALCQLVRFYVGPSFDLHLSLRLRTREIRPTRLTTPSDSVPAGGEGARLGWTSWLLGPPPGEVVEVPIARVRQFQDGPAHLVPDPEPVDPGAPGAPADAPAARAAAPLSAEEHSASARTLRPSDSLDALDVMDLEELHLDDLAEEPASGVVLDEFDREDTNPHFEP